jgi:hypothetical protein
MLKAQFEALSKRVEAQDARITKLEEENSELTEKLAALMEPKKKAPAKTKTVKVEKVKAGAGGPDKDAPAKKKKKSDMTEIEVIEYEIALSLKYIADETKTEVNRNKRTKQLEDERAKLRKLKGETDDDDEKPSVEILTIEELQKLKLDVGGTPGVYSNAGKTVTGPPEKEEETVDVEFDEEEYTVGKTTFRVYQGASKDSFKGYLGVANFKKMVMPKETTLSEDSE